jgi:hypothetical protein
VCKAGHDLFAAVDAGEFRILGVAAQFQCLFDNGREILSSPMCTMPGYATTSVVNTRSR